MANYLDQGSGLFTKIKMSYVMRVFLVFIILFIQYVVQAQKVDNGLYINKESKEFISITDECIQFRLNSKDAFGSFLFGKGHYKFNGKNKYNISPCESLGEQTSILEIEPRRDSLITIRINYEDSTPIIFSSVYIIDVDVHKMLPKNIYVSDTNGMILLSENQIINLVNKVMLLKVEALGFSTEKRILLKRGYNYIIRSIIPIEFPFTLSKSRKFLINSINSKNIKVEILRCRGDGKEYVSTTLSKVDIKPDSDFYLDKDLDQ